MRDENIFETGWSDIEPLKDYGEFQKKLRDLILGYERKVRFMSFCTNRILKEADRIIIFALLF